MNNTLRNTILLFIAVLSTLMHYKHFSKDLVSIHVWRQTQTQSTIVNFYEEDMNILNPHRNQRGESEGIFRMEFPLMQWLVACLYKVFGNHLIITRIFMFVIGLASVIGVYKLLNTLFNNSVLALIGAWAFNFSPSFFYYTINPLPDVFALCCSIWGLALFFNWQKHKKLAYLAFSSILFSAGALCKLPFIIYYSVPVTYFIQTFYSNGFSRKAVTQFAGAISFAILPLAWYLAVIPQWEGNPVVNGMLDNKDSFTTLLDYFQHTLISTLPELLVGYGSILFFMMGLYFVIKNKTFRNPLFWPLFSLSIMAIIYYFFEANAIAKIHDYYLFPFFPVLFILVAYGALNLYISKIRHLHYLALILIVATPITCYLRMQNRWDTTSPGFNKDLLTYKTDLQTAIPNDALVIAGNDISRFIFFYYIDKKGWGYDENNLSPEDLKIMIDRGASYLYSDSDTLLKRESTKKFLDKLILERGSIKIYSLKKS